MSPARDPRGERGFILIFTVLMLLGISALAVGMVYNAHHGRIAAQNYKNRIRAFYAADGVRALLAQEVLDGHAERYIDATVSGIIKGDVYEGAGGSMSMLKGALSGAPSHTDTSDYLGSNWKNKSDYGVVWRGYVIPPSSGPYTFFVRADDEGEFYLSSDDKPANLSASPIATVTSWAFQWPMWGSGVSKPVSLKIGERYYFEFYHTQSVGPGYGQVGWSGPNYLVERPISGKRLAAYGSKSAKWDTTLVGKGRVKYELAEAGPLVYTLNTEAIMGGKGDTTFRSPLAQTLSMRGDNPAPPESLWQHVIYYDFHANGSNPEFNKGACCFFTGGVTPNMVRTKGLNYTTTDASYFGLDSIGKPMLGSNVRYNCGIDNWFRAWKPGWAKWYNYSGGQADCSTIDTPGNDTAFKNVVIKDSLLFKRRDDLGANVYEFQHFGAANMPSFVPIDGKGFGDEGITDGSGVPHNYSFCMELHTKFEHTSGMTFDFDGDDDAWLYINDSLVIDLGFVHQSTFAEVNLDDLPLTFGETYPLDFFYCERQATGSSIDVITNLPVLLQVGKPSSSWKRDYGNTD